MSGARKKVKSMFAALGKPPAPDMAAVSEKPGMTIGPYKLLEQIGAGGMGLVFMACLLYTSPSPRDS